MFISVYLGISQQVGPLDVRAMQNSNGKVRKSSQKINFLEDFCEDSIFFHRELDSFLWKKSAFSSGSQCF